jgi:hypothetical protein
MAPSGTFRHQPAWPGQDSGSCVRKDVGVQVPPRPPTSHSLNPSARTGVRTFLGRTSVRSSDRSRLLLAARRGAVAASRTVDAVEVGTRSQACRPRCSRRRRPAIQTSPGSCGDPAASDTDVDHDRVHAGTFDDLADRAAYRSARSTTAGNTVAVVAETNEHVDSLNAAVQGLRARRGTSDPSTPASPEPRRRTLATAWSPEFVHRPLWWRPADMQRAWVDAHDEQRGLSPRPSRRPGSRLTAEWKGRDLSYRPIPSCRRGRLRTAVRMSVTLPRPSSLVVSTDRAHHALDQRANSGEALIGCSAREALLLLEN